MKKIININLASRLIPIEDSAYEILRQYLDSLKRYFAREEGADEIVSDIEGRIAEIFQDILKKGAHCITDEDVLAVKKIMGTPDQFEETADAGPQPSAQPASDPALNSIRSRKRLFRDPDAKVLGGVCGGLGAYLNVDPVVFRIIFALLAIGGFGSGIVVYFILWIVTPEAVTSADKLQMRGERVDVNNIKAAVQEEINATKAHFKTIGEDVRNFSQGRGRQVGNDIERFFRSFFGGLGGVILALSKGFFYFLAAVSLLILFVVGIIIAVASPVLLPLKSLLLSGTTQNLFFWPAIFLLIGIPIVALIIFLIRKLTGSTQSNRYITFSLSFLWFVGLFCAFMVFISLGRDFRSRYHTEENFALVQPSKGKLVIKKAEGHFYVDELSWIDGECGFRMTEDTVIIDNVRIKIEKSPDANYSVVVERSSRGRNFSMARTFASQIDYQISQQDTVLYLPAGLSIPRDSKFRDQRVVVIIRVPVGKTITREDNIDEGRRYRYENDWNDSDDDWNDEGELKNLEMTNDGLKDSGSDSPAPSRNNRDSVEKNYRYNGREQKSTTPVEDSGSHSSPSATSKAASLEGIDAICYSLYQLVKL